MNTNSNNFVVQPNQKVSLPQISTSPNFDFKKKELKKETEKIVAEIDALQNILYAENRQSLLIIFQGMDAAGKDSTIRAILTGVNPQGVEVVSFKKPTSAELEHDYLWRHYISLPQRGKITIFNRSHYENVLVTRVHPEFLTSENLPEIHSAEDVKPDFWEKRFAQINQFEKTITENGTTILKFMLNVSKEEQKKRFLERIENREKNWKFSSQDVAERKYWNEYQSCFEEMLEKTSTEIAPWYIIPCDSKKFAQFSIATIIKETLQKMNPKFPVLEQEEAQKLQVAYKELLAEK